MKTRQLYLAIALLVAVNLLVLTGVARNRAGTPLAQLQLTERELSLEVSGDQAENSGVSLWLNLNGDNEEKSWFTVERLSELGFARAVVTGDDDWRRLRQRLLPRRGYAVLEYAGAAWERHLERQQRRLARVDADLARGKFDRETAEKRRKRINEGLQAASRLFAVDVGADAAALRARYPDSGRYAVVPVTVRMRIDRSDERAWDEDDLDALLDGSAAHPAGAARQEDGYRVYGVVDAPLVEQLYLAREQQQLLATVIAAEREGGHRYYRRRHDGAPRYRVLVAWGQRCEPWVVDVALTP